MRVIKKSNGQRKKELLVHLVSKQRVKTLYFTFLLPPLSKIADQNRIMNTQLTMITISDGREKKVIFLLF